MEPSGLVWTYVATLLGHPSLPNGGAFSNRFMQELAVDQTRDLNRRRLV